MHLSRFSSTQRTLAFLVFPLRAIRCASLRFSFEMILSYKLPCLFIISGDNVRHPATSCRHTPVLYFALLAWPVCPAAGWLDALYIFQPTYPTPHGPRNSNSTYRQCCYSSSASRKKHHCSNNRQRCCAHQRHTSQYFRAPRACYVIRPTAPTPHGPRKPNSTHRQRRYSRSASRKKHHCSKNRQRCRAHTLRYRSILCTMST